MNMKSKLIALFTVFLMMFGNMPLALATGNPPPQTGTATVKKDVKDLDQSVKLSMDFAFSIAKWDEGTQAYVPDAGVVVTDDTGNAGDGIVDNGGTVVFTNLAVGAKYKITEVAPAGYPLIKFNGTGVSDDGVFTVGKNNRYNFSVKAENNKPKGSLSVHKTVQGLPADQKADGNFKIVIMKKVGNNYITVESRDIDNGETESFSLEWGEYFIYESKLLMPLGYEYVSLSGDGDDASISILGVSVSGKKITVDQDHLSFGMELTNRKMTRTITVQKAAADAPDGDPTIFEYKLYRQKLVGYVLVETKSTTNGGSVVFENLDYLETYKIVESATQNYAFVDFQGPVGTTGNGYVFKVNNWDYNPTVINHNQWLFGTVSVSKTVSGDFKDVLDADKDYVFQIKDASNNVVGQLTAKDGGASPALRLPYGTYTISEVGVAGMTTAFSPSNTTFTIDGSHKAFSFDVTNTQKLREVVITKVIQAGEYATEGEPGATYRFKISGPGNSDHEWPIVEASPSSPGSISLPYGTYTVEELNVPGDYSSTLTDGGVFTIDDQTEQVNITATNTKLYGRLTLNKTVLGMAQGDTPTFTFDVTGPATSSFGTKTVTLDADNGYSYTFDPAPYGEYSITETNIPEGYHALSQFPLTVTVNGENQGTATAEIQNEKLATLNLIKKDSATGLPVAGVKLVVTREEQEEPQARLLAPAPLELTTNADGLVNDGKPLYLQPGKYTITETFAPDGYVPGAPQTIELAAGQTAEVIFLNDPQGWVKIVKTDVLTGAKLADAEFLLANNADFKGAITVKTAADGTVTSAALIPGTWYAKESKAPANYALDATVHTVKIELGKTAELALTNTLLPGALRLVKVDSANDQLKLAGAAFNVFSDEARTKLAASGLTDANGEINISKLVPGTYWVVETGAPTGYLVNATPISVAITANNLTILTLQNTKDNTLDFSDQKAVIKLLKVDGYSQKALAGAKFNLYSDAALKTLVASGTTDSNGLIEFKDLTPGTYYVVETAAPAGYKLNATPISIVTEAAKTSTLTIANELDDTKDYQTGSMDYNILISGGAALLLGGLLVFFTRRRKAKQN